MIYELFLTNKCTRNCVFCDISKGNYKASQDDVQFFIDYIKSKEHKQSFFEIDFFGGEPLLCLDSIYDVCESFEDYSRCSFKLVTNGDLFNNVDVKRLPRSLKLGISAYDIFDDIEKYKSYIERLAMFNVQLQYTFDESSLDKLDSFINICKSLNVNYKIAFSHAAKSWRSISTNELTSIIGQFCQDQLVEYFNDKGFICPSSIRIPFKRLVQSLLDPNMREDYCISKDKITFFNGHMNGSCIRHCNYDIKCPKKCKSCEFKTCCTKSCVAEYIDGNIDEKLCLINKVQFETITKFILEYINTSRMQQILHYEHNDIFKRKK